MEKFDFQRIPAPLLSWYRENKRDLLWRKEPTAYRVWVSEIMLQQTRVEAVKEYYARFMAALPTVEALAYCEEEKLLKLWEGLGYYSRVRNLQKAAKIIVERYDGEFPQTVEELKTILEAKDEETTVIMTGIQLSDELCLLADEVSKIETVNFKVF